jgi:aminoglycoside 2''-phosphotransferase
MESALIQTLTAKIQSAFPALSFTQTRLETYGDDNLVLVLDEEWIFRFSRSAARIPLFQRELRVLEALRPHSPLPLPDYEFVAPDHSFGGYRMIKGIELTPAHFQRLPEPARDKIIVQLADFLSACHGLPLSLLGETPERMTYADIAEVFARQKRSVLAAHLPKSLIDELDNFFGDLATRPLAPTLAVSHGDLSDDHILFDETTGALTGIIDLGDTTARDPANDFAFFWGYGDDVPPRMLARYRGPSNSTWLARSRWAHICFLTIILYRSLIGDDIKPDPTWPTRLSKHLAASRAERA